MKALEILVAVAAILLVFGTVWGAIRRRRSGRKGCGCEGGCPGTCQSCPACKGSQGDQSRRPDPRRQKPSD